MHRQAKLLKKILRIGGAFTTLRKKLKISGSALVDERLVDPPDAAATGLQHLKQLRGKH